MKNRSFDPFAGYCGVLAGASAFLYAVAFIVVARSAPGLGALLSSIFLLLLGLLSSALLTGAYDRLREISAPAALWALLLGFVGAIGSAIHGGFDLSNALHPPNANALSLLGELPSAVDPRGLLTFGVVGVAIATLSWLMARDSRFPVGLARLGYLAAVLLILLYLGRLVILDATSPLILLPAVVSGFIVNPIWYVWLGLVLVRGGRRAA